MPRPLVYGNGSLLLQLDRRGSIRDLFYPRVGLPNHLAGYAIRLGVWVGGRFAWCDGEGWARSQSYRPGSSVGCQTWLHAGLGVRLELEEAVDPVHPWFARRIQVFNLAVHAREIRIFSTHDLRLAETDIGDTAAFVPDADALVHYKGPHAFLFGGRSERGGLDEYTTGLKAFKEALGTWKDAEDGSLDGNPIAQGSVDSTLALHVEVGPNGVSEVVLWMVAGTTLEDVVRQAVCLDPAALLARADAFGKAWLQPVRASAPELPAALQVLYERSLFTVRSQIDNGGAILAANDSDIMETNRATYSYVWPRDGALVVRITDRAGHPELGRRYFEFLTGLVTDERPFFLHKYAPDGSPGASWHPWRAGDIPFQQDETALTVCALYDHFLAANDIERIARWYPKLVSNPCRFLMDFRDPVTGLPRASWDLWEERYGVHCFTVASVVAALRAGAAIADALGDDHHASLWLEGSTETAHAMRRHLWDADGRRYWRMLTPQGEPDPTPDSATLNVGLLGAVPPSDPTFASTVAYIERELSVRSPIGGVARYAGDYYFRQTDAYPGNPWIICTLWLAQSKMLLAKTLEELDAAALPALHWVAARAESTGILAEQYHPESGAPLSVSPLTWSHAEYADTVQLYGRRRDDLQ